MGCPVGGRERRGDRERDHAARHADTAEDKYGTATKAVDGDEGEERREELPGQGATGEYTRHFAAEAQVLLEENGRVYTDKVASTVR